MPDTFLSQPAPRSRVRRAAPVLAALGAMVLVALTMAGAALAAQSTGATAPTAADDRFLPHGYCFLWNRPLLWTHVVSDTLIGIAYVTISFSLAWLVHRARREIPFSRAFVMFGLFIVTCGMTHFLEVVTFWNPIYPTLGAVKVLTAIASVSTAAVMPTLAPRVRATVRDARLARDREIAAARADALAETNAELTRLNASLQEALAAAEAARHAAEAERERAEAANRAKSDFLAVMSHELRTPLNAVVGYAELLELGVTGPITPPQVVQLERIRGSAQHLRGLIDQILHFARIEAGREPVHPEPLDAGAEVRDAAELLRPLAERKGLALVLDLPREAAPLTTDARLLRQAVLNLVSNAVKYTPGGTVTVRLRPASDGAGMRLDVEDTGVGIAPEDQARVFDPFWQAAPALTREAGGTGLGLSVTRQIADLLGGTITLDSAPGRGSRFTLHLPAVLEPSADAPVPSHG